MAIKNLIDSLEPTSVSISASEIKKWGDNISQAKTPKDKTKLRADFKKTYNVNFSQKLVAEIIAKENPAAAVPVSPEPIKAADPEVDNKQKFQTVQAEVKQNVIKLDDLVKMQKSAEDQEATNVVDPELTKAATAIDEERDDALVSAEDALNEFVDPSLSHLSDAEKMEIEILDEKLAALGTAYVSKRQLLTNPDLEKDEAERLEKESLDLEDQMTEVIKQKNEIKGIKEPELTPEPDPTLPPTPEPDPTLPPTPEPDPTLPPTPEPDPNLPPTPEPISSNLDKFRKFSISEEELRGIKEFSNLTEGQQDLVFHGLNQMSLVYVKDAARANVEDMRQSRRRDTGKDLSFWNRNGNRVLNALNGAWSTVTNKYNIAEEEKKELKNVKYGGLSLHGKNLEEITAMISALNVDVVVKDGVPFVNYIQTESHLTKEQNEDLKYFNNMANDFREMPSDWALETASKKEREDYNIDLKYYELAKKDALEILKNEYGETDALLRMLKIDAQVKMMQALYSNPDAYNELIKIEKQSSIRKALSGEAAARGSYMAGGFAVRHTLAGVISFGAGIPIAFASFAAMPLAAAGIGAWRAKNRAKETLNEKDITGRKSDEKNITNIEAERKYVYEEIKRLVPSEYALNPREWLSHVATEEQGKRYLELSDRYGWIQFIYQERNEAQRDKTAKNFNDADNLSKKLQIAVDKTNSNSSWENYKADLYNLQVRLGYTEDKLRDGLVNFGKEEGLVNKLELIQSISEARKILIMNESLIKDREKELAENYKNNSDVSKDLQARFDKLFESKKFAALDNLDDARKKYVIQQMIYGAGIGATFAIAGTLIRELAAELGIIGTPHFGKGASHGGGNAEQAASSAKSGSSSAAENADSNATENTGNNTEAAAKSGGAAEAVEETATTKTNTQEAGVIKTFIDEITSGDSVWRSTRDLFKNHAEELGYEGDIDDATALNKWAETQTANAIHNTGEFTDKVFEGNKVLLEKNASGDFIVKVEAGSGATPGFSETIEPGTGSGNPAEEVVKTPSGNPVETPVGKPAGLGAEKIVTTGAETVTDPNEAAADVLAKKYFLDPKQFSYGGAEGVIKTTVDDHDLFIDTNTGTQFLGSLDGSRGAVELTGAGILNAISEYKGILEHTAPIEALAKQSGFDLGKSIINSRDQLITTLANHQIAIDFKSNTLNYEWNGENHEFQFSPGEAAKINIEKFLTEHGQLEKLAEGIQDNLMNGKIKSFAALQSRLEEINGGNRLTDGERSLWREIFQENFGRKSSGLLEDGSKFKILQSTMNVFLSGGAK